MPVAGNPALYRVSVWQSGRVGLCFFMLRARSTMVEGQSDVRAGSGKLQWFDPRTLEDPAMSGTTSAAVPKLPRCEW